MQRSVRFTIVFCLMFATSLSAQELEPRAYAYAPVGLKFVVLAYHYSTGDLIFDPTLPVEDADARVNIGALAYVTTIGVFGKTGKLAIVVPAADGKAQGLLNGEPAERLLSGLGDAKLGFTWLFYGAPARTGVEFMKADRSATVAGVTVGIGIPIGKYEKERLLNIGANRFALKTEIGVSHRFKRWTIEGAAAVTVFQDNDEFYGGSTRTQDPIYSMQAHLVRDFRPRLWAAFDATYYWGGQARVDGTLSGVELGNNRLGVTFSFPIAKTQSLKLTASSGISTRTGTDFDSYGVAWQWAIPPKM